MVAGGAIKFSFYIGGITKLISGDEDLVKLIGYSLFGGWWGRPSQVLYLLLLSKKVLAALSWYSLIMFKIAWPVFDSLGLPKVPRRLKIGSNSWWSHFSEGVSWEGLEALAPIDALVSAPMIWLVL